jgi:hypothetical protein
MTLRFLTPLLIFILMSGPAQAIDRIIAIAPIGPEFSDEQRWVVVRRADTEGLADVILLMEDRRRGVIREATYENVLAVDWERPELFMLPQDHGLLKLAVELQPDSGLGGNMELILVVDIPRDSFDGSDEMGLSVSNFALSARRLSSPRDYVVCEVNFWERTYSLIHRNAEEDEPVHTEGTIDDTFQDLSRVTPGYRPEACEALPF